MMPEFLETARARVAEAEKQAAAPKLFDVQKLANGTKKEQCPPALAETEGGAVGQEGGQQRLL